MIKEIFVHYAEFIGIIVAVGVWLGVDHRMSLIETYLICIVIEQVLVRLWLFFAEAGLRLLKTVSETLRCRGSFLLRG